MRKLVEETLGGVSSSHRGVNSTSKVDDTLMEASKMSVVTSKRASPQFSVALKQNDPTNGGLLAA